MSNTSSDEEFGSGLGAITGICMIPLIILWYRFIMELPLYVLPVISWDLLLGTVFLHIFPSVLLGSLTGQEVYDSDKKYPKLFTILSTVAIFAAIVGGVTLVYLYMPFWWGVFLVAVIMANSDS